MSSFSITIPPVLKFALVCLLVILLLCRLRLLVTPSERLFVTRGMRAVASRSLRNVGSAMVAAIALATHQYYQQLGKFHHFSLICLPPNCDAIRIRRRSILSFRVSVKALDLVLNKPVRLKSARRNKVSAHQHADIIDAYLANEVDLGRVAGPFVSPPVRNLHIRKHSPANGALLWIYPHRRVTVSMMALILLLGISSTSKSMTLSRWCQNLGLVLLWLNSTLSQHIEILQFTLRTATFWA